MPRRRRTGAQLRELEELSSTPYEALPNATTTESQIEVSSLVQALANLTGPSRRHLKPPQYSGVGDVDLFLTQFEDVAMINGWSEEESLLHLRLSLTGKARDCSRAESIAEVQVLLRSHFGVNVRQARERD